MLTYTNHIDPANRVIASAMRFWTFSPRCLAGGTSAGCSGVLTLGWVAICRLLQAQPGHALPCTGTSMSITPYAAVDPGPARAQGGTLTAGDSTRPRKGRQLSALVPRRGRCGVGPTRPLSILRRATRALAGDGLFLGVAIAAATAVRSELNCRSGSERRGLEPVARGPGRWVRPREQLLDSGELKNPLHAFRAADERDGRVTVLSGSVDIEQRPDARRVDERQLAEVDGDRSLVLRALHRFLNRRSGGHVEFAGQRHDDDIAHPPSVGLEDCIRSTHGVASWLAVTVRIMHRHPNNDNVGPTARSALRCRNFGAPSLRLRVVTNR